MHTLKIPFLLFVVAVLSGCMTTLANAQLGSECDSDLDCQFYTCRIDDFRVCEEAGHYCREDATSTKFGYCEQSYVWRRSETELCETDYRNCREFYWTCDADNRCALGEDRVYQAFCNNDTGQDDPSSTVYDCAYDPYSSYRDLPSCVPYTDYAPGSDSCTDTGNDLGGGTCSASNWICEDGIFTEIVTGGTDSCYDGDPDNPSLKFWECKTFDGSVADTCESSIREEQDRCDDFGGFGLGGGGCDATNWVCSGTTLVRITSGGNDSCGGDEDNPSVTHWSCADPMDGTVADTCTSTPIRRQDECEQSGGDNLGGGTCEATNWYCDPGNGFTTAMLKREDMYEVDRCNSISNRVSHYICGSVDGGYLTDSCVAQEQDCDAPHDEGGLGDVCTNGVCPQDGTYCIAQNRPAGDDCRNGDPDVGSGLCDARDTCDGNGACDLNIADDGFVCRPGTGECNPQEVCNGEEGYDCPPDDFKAEGEPCGDGSTDNDCDAPDTCNASGECENNVKPGGTPCRAGSPDNFCDPREECRGVVGEDCPADEIKAPGVVCRTGSGDVCDPDERCTGVALADCPTDEYKTADFVCNPSSTGFEQCDPTELCPGEPGNPCPDDVIEPEGTACGSDSVTACTEPDSCDASGTCLPNNRPCALVTSSSLCTFDVQPDKGMCSRSAQACVVDPGCEAAGGKACGDGQCRDADGYPLDPVVTCSDGCSDPGDYCEQTGQFRLVFTPDVKNFPAYKLPASNPGQTYYNAVVKGDPDTTVTVGIDIPYPYVTVGGQPVHVYDAYDVVGMCVDSSTGEVTGQACDFMAYPDSECGDGEHCDSSCFAPTLALQQFDIRWNIEDYFGGGGKIGYPGVTCDDVCGPDGAGSCTFNVEVSIPASGQAYLNVHLDYGLKGAHEDANPCDDGLADRYDQGDSSGTGFADVGFDAWVNNDTQDGALGIGIADCTDYAFGHSVGGQTFDDSVQNLNVFKPIAGAFGRSGNSLSGLGHGGLKLTLAKSSNPGTILRTATTDQDGFYTLPYKHTGKPAWYRVSLYDESGTQPLGSIGIELQGNGWTQIDFDSHATHEELCDIDKVFCECNGWCAAAEYGSGRQSGGSSGGGGGGGVCELARAGESCEVDSDCCSSACKGKPDKKTCK